MKNKPKSCKWCKEGFQPRLSTQVVCSRKCAIKYSRLKDWLKEKKEKEKKEGKGKDKDIEDWKKELQTVVNWIVRELDKDLPCISHPDMKNFLRYDAGHYFTVKAHAEVRYNLHNIHKQNSYANEKYGGNADYANGLKERYGSDYLEMVLGLPLLFNNTAKDNFTISNIKEVYLPNAKRVQVEMKNGAEFTRDYINELIGIYY
jgi:hypothetical protein